MVRSHKKGIKSKSFVQNVYIHFDSVQFLHDLTIFEKNPVAMRSTQRGVHWISCGLHREASIGYHEIQSSHDHHSTHTKHEAILVKQFGERFPGL